MRILLLDRQEDRAQDLTRIVQDECVQFLLSILQQYGLVRQFRQQDGTTGTIQQSHSARFLNRMERLKQSSKVTPLAFSTGLDSVARKTRI